MQRRSQVAGSAVATLAILIVWTGCRHDDPTAVNLPPDTYLVDAPAYSQSGFYINHIYWDGFDPDGRVSHFEITITDSTGNLEEAVWRATARTDSLVRFQVGGDNGLDQVLGNRFYVRSVDTRGRPDPSPAWIFFGARNPEYPDVIFTAAEGSNPDWPNPDEPAVIALGPSEQCESGFPPDTLPAGADVRFVWTATDRDSLYGTEVGAISHYEYKLLTEDNTFIGGTASDTAATYENLAQGTHSFVVRAFDTGGLAGEGCRYFQVNFDPRCSLKRVRNSCTGEDVIAFRLSTRSFRASDDPCAPGFEFDEWSPALVGLPELPVNPCLPPGYYSANDTLPAGVTAQPWWFEAEVTCKDVDGELVELEANYGFCATAPNGQFVCRLSTWECAARVVGTDTTLVIGPLSPGDTRFVIAGVDDLGQRGASNADTIDTFIDFAPRLVHVAGDVRTEPCDNLAGDVGDVVGVCASESLLVVRSVQSTGALGAPCAVATNYAAGGSSPYAVADFGSIPLPGERYDLEFTPELPPRRRSANLGGGDARSRLDARRRRLGARGVSPMGDRSAAEPHRPVRARDHQLQRCGPR